MYGLLISNVNYVCTKRIILQLYYILNLLNRLSDNRAYHNGNGNA